MTRSRACALLIWLSACRPEQGAPRKQEGPAQDFGAKAERPGAVSAEQEGPRVAARYATPDVSAFHLPDACEFRSSSAEKRRAPPDRVRIASWNVRWFPDSVYVPSSEDHPGTDTAWLSCAMAELDAQVIAVQEFRRHARAKSESEELLSLLNRRTGGDWRLELDRCPDTPSGNESHVGFLYDARRVTASRFSNVDELNPMGGCNGGYHPGFAGLFRFPGGLDLTLVSVHLAWGEDSRSLELRRRSRGALRAPDARLLEPGDDDLLVLGDFNTNGCRDCGAPLDPIAEVREAASEAARAWPRLTLLDNDLACTEYDGGRPLPLDHVAVTSSTKELPKDARVRVSGVCPELGCRTFDRDSSLFHARLSDHCPIVVELIDRDWD